MESAFLFNLITKKKFTINTKALYVGLSVVARGGMFNGSCLRHLCPFLLYLSNIYIYMGGGYKAARGLI